MLLVFCQLKMKKKKKEKKLLSTMLQSSICSKGHQSFEEPLQKFLVFPIYSFGGQTFLAFSNR